MLGIALAVASLHSLRLTCFAPVVFSPVNFPISATPSFGSLDTVVSLRGKEFGRSIVNGVGPEGTSMMFMEGGTYFDIRRALREGGERITKEDMGEGGGGEESYEGRGVSIGDVKWAV